MKWFIQIFEVTRNNLMNIPSRLMDSIVIVVGICGVVVVLSAILSMSKGFESTLTNTGKDDRILVLRDGAKDELRSFLPGEKLFPIKHQSAVEKQGDTLLAAAQTYLMISTKKKSGDNTVNVPMRGVEPTAFVIRDEIKLIDGRQFETGKFEMIVGKNAAGQFQGLQVGDELPTRYATWRIVGIFESGGNLHESEVWVDYDTLQSVIGRSKAASSVLIKLKDASYFDSYEQALEDDKTLQVSALKESEYYAEQSEMLGKIIRIFGYSITVIMSFGAIFGALNTMYSTISVRSVEIACLKAIGFGNSAIIISVIIESIFLSLIGGGIGACVTYLLFNGITFSTFNVSNMSQIVFDFQVTRNVLLQGIYISCILGVIGGLLPAIKAARLPIPQAIREQ